MLFPVLIIPVEADDSQKKEFAFTACALIFIDPQWHRSLPLVRDRGLCHPLQQPAVAQQASRQPFKTDLQPQADPVMVAELGSVSTNRAPQCESVTIVRPLALDL